MSLALYAILDPTKTVIVAFETIDSAAFAAFPVIKSQYYRITNMIAQPVFNPATQYVSQIGWTITGVDVQPIWQINALSAADQTSYTANQLWQTTLATNLVTAFNAYAAVAVPSQAQTTAVVLQLVKCVRALLQSQYGISN
jgi:hypothetical protein